MIWVVWRRQRAALLAAFGLVAAAALVMVAYRLLVTAAAAPTDVSACLDGPNSEACLGSDVVPVFLRFDARFGGLYDVGYGAMLTLPVVVGVCAGAGLFAAELEQGTAVLALTQSVSRLRWWTTGLLVAGVPAAAAVALLTPAAAWALGLTGSADQSRLEAGLFQTTGLAPAAYTLLAFGVAAVGGLLLRSTLGAVVLAAVVQVALVAGLAGVLRRHYASADELRTPLPYAAVPGLSRSDIPDGALWLDRTYLDAAGRPIPDPVLDVTPCPVDVDFYDCLRADGVVQELTLYHDAGKYWLFQMIEAGIVLAVVAILLGVGARSLRRVS